MLIVMSFTVELFISAGAGIGVGHFVFNLILARARTENKKAG